jgi:2-polyprenyl-6-methoxyphenol hydroxylase-like FAD-dependent oxidoreductase
MDSRDGCSRFILHDERTLFLFVFAADSGSLPERLALQKAMLHELYFARVNQIRMKRRSQGRAALVGDAALCVSFVAGQDLALGMISAYVLAGELANAGATQTAVGKHEAFLQDFQRFRVSGGARRPWRGCIASFSPSIAERQHPDDIVATRDRH